jgi:hypothetical protein
MQEKVENILALYRREPEQTELILKLGLATPLVIILFHWIGNYVMPGILVSLIALAMILMYGAVLAILSGSLIHSIQRWEVESAVQARQLLTGDRRRRRPEEPAPEVDDLYSFVEVDVDQPAPPPPPAHRPPAPRPREAQPWQDTPARPREAAQHQAAPPPRLTPRDVPQQDAPDPPRVTPLPSRQAAPARDAELERLYADLPATPPPVPHYARFQEVYFLLRLQEDVLRARREGHELSVIVLNVTLPGGDATPTQMEKLAFDVAHLASNQAQTISLPLQVGDTEFAFSLPLTDQQAAKAFVSRLVQNLGEYWCHYGMASYPHEGTDAESLYVYAREQCRESMEGRPASSKRGIGSLLRRSS